jgi:uncharacterized membrane protein YcaP (DUF421 family)
MEYKTMFDAIPWDLVGISMLQSFIIYWIVLFGLKMVGRRVFGELGPQDLIILLLISEASNQGLVHEDAGFWGAIGGALALLITIGLVERIPPLRKKLDDTALTLVEQGRPLTRVMKQNLVEMGDLEKKARDYGMPNYDMFESMMLEGDGSITGVLKPEYRGRVNIKEARENNKSTYAQKPEES